MTPELEAFIEAVPEIGPRQSSENHSAAVSILREKACLGQPFVLHLRKYGRFRPVLFNEIGEPYKYLGDVLQKLKSHGLKTISVQQEENILEELASDVLVQVDRNLRGKPHTSDSGDSRQPFPGLVVPTDQWQAIVAELVRFADVIFMDFDNGSESLDFELQLCLDTGMTARTVLVLPDLDDKLSSNIPTAEAAIERPLFHFPRTVFDSELRLIELENHPLISDLIRLVGTIEPNAREPNSEVNSLHKPESYTGVLHRYQEWIRFTEISEEWMLYAWTRVSFIFDARYKLGIATVGDLVICAMMHASIGLILCHHRRDFDGARQAYLEGSEALREAQSLADANGVKLLDAFVVELRLDRLKSLVG